MALKISLTSVLVQDQARAEAFYVGILGFVKRHDVPLGEARWLTVISPEEPKGVELLLEPLGFPPAETYQKALFEAGIPATSFAVDDVAAEHRRLVDRGVVFRRPPTPMGPVTVATFEDTCGNLIQIAQA